jgi:glutaminyl-peptide cyclotransferase
MEESLHRSISSFDGKKAFGHLEYMESLGPRVPDSPAIESLRSYILETGSKTKAEYFRQDYSFDFRGIDTNFSNLAYIFKGRKPGKKILLGTHYDSRVIADRENDGALRNMPIMGINDGGSGTAVFIELLGIINDNRPDDDVALVFFDAEDVGNIDGHEFSEGAEYFARHFDEFKPDEVIVIDMIGGTDACYQLDYEAFYSTTSNKLATKIWQTGINLGLKPFTSNSKFEGSFFICDHTPFVKRNIPSMLLIDINYRWWHTQDDMVSHCSPASLEAAGKVLLHHIYNLS